MTGLKLLRLRRLGSISRDTKALLILGEQEEFMPLLRYP